MGEPQRSRVDSNPRLRRRSYRPDLRVHMWRAVVASACVPVLFEPVHVPFDTGGVNLLDGGVHDNQGTSALLEHDCTLLLVSDASGQFSDDPSASTSFAAVGLRADAIVQERLRIALYDALESRRKGSLLRGMMFLHLRLGLRRPRRRADVLRDSDRNPTPHLRRSHRSRRVQRCRSAVADAQWLPDGARSVPRQLPDVRSRPRSNIRWGFRAVRADADLARVSRPPGRALDLAASRFFKAWRASRS